MTVSRKNKHKTYLARKHIRKNTRTVLVNRT